MPALAACRHRGVGQGETVVSLHLPTITYLVAGILCGIASAAVAIARFRAGGRHWWERDHSADINPADGELSWIAFMLAIGSVVLTVLYLVFR